MVKMNHYPRVVPFLHYFLFLLLAPALSASPSNAKGLATKYLCLVCHKVEGKLIGPPYREVATKYRGITEAQPMLVAKIKKGGLGVWGTVPMPPMNVPDKDLEIIVAWILGGAK